LQDVAHKIDGHLARDRICGAQRDAAAQLRIHDDVFLQNFIKHDLNEALNFDVHEVQRDLRTVVRHLHLFAGLLRRGGRRALPEIDKGAPTVTTIGENRVGISSLRET
jgi:hypothetical protein